MSVMSAALPGMQMPVAPTMPVSTLPKNSSPQLLHMHGQQLIVEGNTVLVQHVFTDPFLCTIDNFVTPAECDYMRKLTRAALAPSRVVNTGSSVSRSSTSCRVPRTDVVVDRILKRVLAFLQLPFGTDHMEPIQVVHYDPSQEYKPHFDFFDPRDCDYSEHMKRGGQRVFTVFVYLNQVEGGGTTSFPNLKVSMKPVEGRAVFWSNQRASDGQMDPRMLHSGDPVTSGEKFGMNIWIRDGAWVQPGDAREVKVQPTFIADDGHPPEQPSGLVPPPPGGYLPFQIAALQATPLGK